jgi:heme/copper-type cytochrome/quinol oxidase subunit 2
MGFNMAKQNYYQPGNFDAGQYNKNLKNLLKKLLAIILAVIVFYIVFFITAVCHLEHNAERAAVEMEKAK